MTDLITCPRCGTENRASQYFCSSCRLNLHMSGEATRGVQESAEAIAQSPKEVLSPPPTKEIPGGTPQHAEHAAQGGKDIAALMPGRYKDAYNVSRTIVAFGTAVKVIGIVAGVLSFLMGLSAISFGGWTMIMGSLILAAWVGGTVYLFGIIIAAQGQILQATLDTAVNTSPFLDNEQRVKLMHW